jgi:hypothetical protein
MHGPKSTSARSSGRAANSSTNSSAPSGAIEPGLADHAARNYPGAHIDFQTLDTARAKLFLADLAAHGLA